MDDLDIILFNTKSNSAAVGQATISRIQWLLSPDATSPITAFLQFTFDHSVSAAGAPSVKFNFEEGTVTCVAADANGTDYFFDFSSGTSAGSGASGDFLSIIVNNWTGLSFTDGAQTPTPTTYDVGTPPMDATETPELEF